MNGTKNVSILDRINKHFHNCLSGHITLFSDRLFNTINIKNELINNLQTQKSSFFNKLQKFVRIIYLNLLNFDPCAL